MLSIKNLTIDTITVALKSLQKNSHLANFEVDSGTDTIILDSGVEFLKILTWLIFYRETKGNN